MPTTLPLKDLHDDRKEVERGLTKAMHIVL